MSTDALSRESILEVLRELIAIPSVNPELAPTEAHGEAAVAAFARVWLEARGLKAWLDEAAPGRPNVVAEVGVGGGPTLVLCAHLDTVGTAGMTIPPFEPRVDGNRVYGRGSYDMKGGAAAIMAAAAALVDRDLSGTVRLALVADEEAASVGAEHFVGRYRADGCILTEPSEGRLILGHRGFAWVEVVTTGRAVHGSRWDLGVSAIGKMGRIVAALEELDRNVLRTRVDPLVGPASLHCALIEGGIGLSTYAPECRLQVERRTIAGETDEQVLRDVEEAVRRAGEEAAVRIVFGRPPLTCDPSARVVHCLRAATTAVTGSAPEEAGVPYWMDAALFGAAGIPTANYGPLGHGAHEPVEWVDLDSVVTVAEVLADSAERFCRPD